MPRLHHTLDEVRQLLRTAETQVAAAERDVRARPDSAAAERALFAAEQTLRLVRLAADSGTRRGELTALRRSDLDGRVLTIQRGVSAGILGPTKTGRTRRLTLGPTTINMIQRHFDAWEARAGTPADDWIFAPPPARHTFTTAAAHSHRFRRLGPAADVRQPALLSLR
nr:hypothetical protein [Micromonospora sp. DSM 115978]